VPKSSAHLESDSAHVDGIEPLLRER